MVQSQNTTVVTQNNINDIVNAIIENSTVSEQALPKVIDTVKKLVNSANSIKGGPDAVKKVVRYVNSYKDIVTTIVGTLCKDLPGEGKTLSDMLGRIEKPDEYDSSKTTVQWTVIDAAQQIPKIIDSTSKMFESISGFKMGFKTMINFKRNVVVFKWMISDALAHFVNVFANLANDEKMDLILQKLIKQPDIVNEHIKNGYEYSNDGVKRIVSDDIKKNSKQGAFGLLDIVDKTFSMMSLLNSIKLPNFIKFKITRKKLSNQLSAILESLIGVFETLNKKYEGKLFSKIQWMSRIVVGDGEDSDGSKKGAMIGLFQMSLRLNMLIEQISTIGLNEIRKKKITIAFTNFGELLDKLIEIFTSNNFYALASKDTVTRISKVGETVNSFIGLISSLQDAIKGIIFLKVFRKSIINAIDTMALIVYTINRRFANVELGNTDVLSDIETIIGGLINITKQLTYIGLLALPAIGGALLGSLMLLVIRKTLLPAFVAFNRVVNAIMKDATKSTINFELIIGSLIIIGISIIAFVKMLPYLIECWWGIFVYLGVMLLVSIALWGIFKILGKITLKTLPDVLIFGSIMAIMMGVLIASGLTIMLAAKLATEIINTGAIGSVILMILGMVALTTILMLIGIGVMAISGIMVGAMTGFGSIFILLATLLGISVMINKMAELELKTDKAKENIEKIFDFIKELRRILNGKGDEENIFGVKKKVMNNGKWRKDKKAAKQIANVVNHILEIANTIKQLEKIEFNEDNKNKLIGDKGTIPMIFECITEIEKKMATFNKDTGTGLTYRREQINTRKRMRRNKRVLNKVDKVINKIADIKESLLSIKKFTLTEDEKVGLIKNVGHIFGCVNTVDNEIRKFNGLTVLGGNDGTIGETKGFLDRMRERRAARKQRKEYKHNAKTMSKVEACILSIDGVVDTLNEIKEFKITEKDINDKIDNIFGCVNHVATKINASTITTLDNKAIKKFTPIVESINGMTDPLKIIGEADPSKTSQNVDSYIRFIEKVNTVEVEKAQKTAQMFEKMSKFSASIKGDFDKLAESLSDKLLPVLTDLKDIMEKVPEKIDASSQNISASIGATNAAPTTENIAAQVKRENPNLTMAEAEKLVNTRISERAAADANGMIAKLDEVLALLRGYSGNVIVKTI